MQNKEQYQPGWIIGHRYEIIRRFRPESFGEVVIARDQVLDVEVGLKILPTNDPQFDRNLAYYQAEAALGLKLHHPQILGVHHLDETPDCVFLVQEPFEGTPLLELLGRQERLSVPDALYFIEILSKGLAFAHKQGVIHQNFNPCNVLVSATEGVKVANFAFPAVAEAKPPPEIEAYVPPEVLQGQSPTPASNLFSLGVLGYRMLTGSLPFPLTQGGAFPYQIDAGPAEWEAVPAELRALLAPCLEKNPNNRFQSMVEFLVWLSRSRELLESAEETPAGKPSAVSMAAADSREKPVLEKPEAQITPVEPGTESLPRPGFHLGLANLIEQGRSRLQSYWARCPLSNRQILTGLGLGGVLILLFLTVHFLITAGDQLPPAGPAMSPSGPPAPEASISSGALVSPETPQQTGSEARPESSPAAATVKIGEQYRLLVATYSTPHYAQKLQAKLGRQGYPSYIKRAPGRNRTYYQVWLRALPTLARAKAAARAIKAAYGITPKIVKVKNSAS